MPDDAIGYAFNDKAATMSITVLNLTEASALLRTINKRDIKDVRAIDLDLALVLESGHKIIISRGAVAAVNSPQLMLEFADGDVALGDVFEKLNHIEVPADAAVTVTSKEITRYGIKRVVKPKVARNKQDQEADKDKTDEETVVGLRGCLNPVVVADEKRRRLRDAAGVDVPHGKPCERVRT